MPASLNTISVTGCFSFPPFWRRNVVNLSAHEGYLLKRQVQRIHHQDHLDRRIRPDARIAECAERQHLARLIVVEYFEVPGLQSRHRLSRAVIHHNIQLDLSFGNHQALRLGCRSLGEHRTLAPLLLPRLRSSRRARLPNRTSTKALKRDEQRNRNPA